jgi:geranylgeranyl reductase
MTDRQIDTYDAVVIGGGPSGATAAEDLARLGHRVALIDKNGRIKPCGGAIPPRLIRDFQIPEELLCARIRSARMVSPTQRTVDMPIDGGFVGMVDREVFDEFLRSRAARTGATRITGTYERISRDGSLPEVHYTTPMGNPRSVLARLVIGADGALSKVCKQEVTEQRPKSVFAYHEIVKVPEGTDFDGTRCDVVYDGKTSPDFYGWVFPHGNTVSVGTGSAQKAFKLKSSVRALRDACGLGEVETVRREGAPIPMEPLRCWDNGRDVVLAGDAAGVVAPSSGEGIYYAMVGGRLAADAGHAFLETQDARELGGARRAFMKAHGRVFWVLGMMQYFFYVNDSRRERFVSMCEDPDVQSLTWQAYMNKELVRAKPGAHLRIFMKDVAHLLGLVSPTRT